MAIQQGRPQRTPLSRETATIAATYHPKAVGLWGVSSNCSVILRLKQAYGRKQGLWERLPADAQRDADAVGHVELGSSLRGRPRIKPRQVCGGKGYGSRRIQAWLRRQGIHHAIPRKTSERRTGPFSCVVPCPGKALLLGWLNDWTSVPQGGCNMIPPLRERFHDEV